MGHGGARLGHHESFRIARDIPARGKVRLLRSERKIENEKLGQLKTKLLGAGPPLRFWQRWVTHAANLAVPTFTENVKVGQPPAAGRQRKRQAAEGSLGVPDYSSFLI
jgi:hypothetical protein